MSFSTRRFPYSLIVHCRTSQCPQGHDVFLHGGLSEWTVKADACRNARKGMMSFSTRRSNATAASDDRRNARKGMMSFSTMSLKAGGYQKQCGRNARKGMMSFSTSDYDWILPIRTVVAMPARA